MKLKIPTRGKSVKSARTPSPISVKASIGDASYLNAPKQYSNIIKLTRAPEKEVRDTRVPFWKTPGFRSILNSLRSTDTTTQRVDSNGNVVTLNVPKSHQYYVPAVVAAGSDKADHDPFWINPTYQKDAAGNPIVQGNSVMTNAPGTINVLTLEGERQPFFTESGEITERQAMEQQFEETKDPSAPWITRMMSSVERSVVLSLKTLEYWSNHNQLFQGAVAWTEFNNQNDNPTPMGAGLNLLFNAGIYAGEVINAADSWFLRPRIDWESKSIKFLPYVSGDPKDFLSLADKYESMAADLPETSRTDPTGGNPARDNYLRQAEEARYRAAELERNLTRVEDAKLALDRVWNLFTDSFSSAITQIQTDAEKYTPQNSDFIEYSIKHNGLIQVVRALFTPMRMDPATMERNKAIEDSAYSTSLEYYNTLKEGLQPATTLPEKPNVRTATQEQMARAAKGETVPLHIIMKEQEARYARAVQAMREPLTQEQATGLYRTALEQMMIAQAARYSQVAMDPTWSATWIREPEREEAFRKALADFELQAGRPPTTYEIRKLKQLYTNMGTEFLSEAIFDPLNFVPDPSDFVPESLKLALREYKGAARNIVDKTPILGWLTRESLESVAGKRQTIVYEALQNIAKSYDTVDAYTKDLARIGEILFSSINLNEVDLKAAYSAARNSGPVGFKFISFDEFIKLRDLTDVAAGGIDYKQWSKLYETAVSKADGVLTEVITRRVTNELKNSSPEEISIEVARRLNDLPNKPGSTGFAELEFSRSFSEAFLAPHRIHGGDTLRESSRLLDDTLFGQLVQKLRILAGDTSMPVFEKIEGKIARAVSFRDRVSNIKDIFTSASGRQIKEVIKDLAEAITENKLSFGDNINVMLMKLSEKGASNPKTALMLADSLELVSSTLRFARSLWTTAVLSLNPRWFLQNLVDSVGRNFIAGGNPLEDLGMLFRGTHAQLVDELGFLPVSLGQSLADNALDFSSSVPARLVYGEWDGFGLMNYWKYRKDLIEKTSQEASQNAPAILKRITRGADSLREETLGEAAQTVLGKGTNFMDSFRTSIQAITGATTDFNNAIEFTVRLRMFHREYFGLMDKLGVKFAAAGTENLTPELKSVVKHIWDVAGGNSAKLEALTNSLIGEGTSKRWSMFIPSEVESKVQKLTMAERQAFYTEIGDKVQGMYEAIRKSGAEVTPDNIRSYFSDLRQNFHDEVSSRLSMDQSQVSKMHSGIGSEPSNLPTMEDASKMKLTMTPEERAAMANISTNRRFAKTDKVFSNFETAVGQYAKVERTDKTGWKVVRSNTGDITVQIGKDLLDNPAGQTYDILHNITIDIMAEKDIEILRGLRFDKTEYSDAFRRFIKDPAEILNEDEKMFRLIASQLEADPILREVLERTGGINPAAQGFKGIPYESVLEISEKTLGLTIDDIRGPDWNKLLEMFGDSYTRPPAATRIAALSEADTTVQIQKIINSDRIPQELKNKAQTFLDLYKQSSLGLGQFYSKAYPGPRLESNTLLRRAKWDLFHQMRELNFTNGKALKDGVLDLLRKNPEEANAFLDAFMGANNSNFFKSYLEAQGFKDLIFDDAGNVSSFAFSLPNGKTKVFGGSNLKMDAIRKELSEQFFTPEIMASLTNGSRINMADAALGQEKKTMIAGLRDSFHLNQAQAEAYSRAIYEYADNMEAMSGTPANSYIERLGFQRVDGQLTVSSALRLAQSNSTDGRVLFYGFGEKNFTSLVQQTSVMFYDDLVEIAAKNESVMTDFRSLRSFIEQKSGEKIVGSLTKKQTEIFASMFQNYIEKGETISKLKGPFEKFRQYLSVPFKNVFKEDSIVSQMDPDVYIAMDRLFTGSKLDPPASNARYIKLLAKDNGIVGKEKEILAMINADAAVTGFTPEIKAGLTEAWTRAGIPSEQSEALFDLMHGYAHAWSASTGKPPEDWFSDLLSRKGLGSISDLSTTTPEQLDQIAYQLSRPSSLHGTPGTYMDLFSNPDPLHVVDELPHVFLGEMTRNDLRLGVIEKWMGLNPGELDVLRDGYESYRDLNTILDGELPLEQVDKILDQLTTSKAQYDRFLEAHEKFASGHRAYLKTGKAPSPTMKDSFGKFQGWLTSLWEKVRGTSIDLDDEIVKIYDSMYRIDPKTSIAPRRYSSLKDVPAEVAERVFKTEASARMSNEMEAAFSVWKMNRSVDGFPSDVTSSYATFRKHINNRLNTTSGEVAEQYRKLNWEMEQFEDAVLSHHYGDDLKDALFPKIPTTEIGENIQTVIRSGQSNIRVLEAVDSALDEWEAALIKQAEGSNHLAYLTDEEKNALREWMKVASEKKAELQNLLINGGAVRNADGSVFASTEGALAKTNRVMLDYQTVSNFDKIMKNFFPFWMFPSRSVPFWAETLMTHPQIISMYMKLKRLSQSNRYQAGAVDSKGRPLASLDGYIQIPNTDLWFNPLAAFSFRYLLDMGNFADNLAYQNQGETDDSISPLAYVAREFLETAPVLGFSPAPWTGWMLKTAFNLSDDVLPSFSPTPQLSLIPRWTVAEYLHRPEKGIANWLFPEPEWYDYMVEKRILENALQQMESGSLTDSQIAQLKIQVTEAIDKKGDNPLWQSTYMELTNDDASRNMISFFTGVYTKRFTDGQADLIKLRNDVNVMKDAMNNDYLATAEGLPFDPEDRYAYYKDKYKNMEVPEGYIYQMYKNIGWVTNSEGNLVSDRQERAKIVSARIADMNLEQEVYANIKDLVTARDAALRALPVGAAPAQTAPIYQEYFRQYDLQTARLPDYIYYGTDKPVELIEKDLRDKYWRMLSSTAPQWAVARGEKYEEYEAKYNAWLEQLPEIAQSFQNDFERNRDVLGVYHNLKSNQVIDPNFIQLLVDESNAAGMAAWKLENDTVFTALNTVWKNNIWDRYWDAVSGIDGAERDLAEYDFYQNNPTPTPETLYQWVSALYGDRFTYEEVMKWATWNPDGGNKVYNPQDRINVGKSDADKARDEIWDILSMAGPGRKKDELLNAYAKLGGDMDLLTVWYEESGKAFMSDEIKLMAMRDMLRRAGTSVELKAPTREELLMRVEAERQNDVFNAMVDAKFGPEFRSEEPGGVLFTYYNLLDAPGGYQLQKEWKKEHPKEWAQISEYKSLRNQYAGNNPLWGAYYVLKININAQNLPAFAEGPSTEPTVPFTGYSSPTSPSEKGYETVKGGESGNAPVRQGQSKKTSKIVPLTFPSGFQDIAGEALVTEIYNLYKYNRWLSKPAKDYLYKLAKSHPKWRGFIYKILSK